MPIPPPFSADEPGTRQQGWARVLAGWLLTLACLAGCARNPAAPPTARSYEQQLSSLEQADSLRNFSAGLA